MGYIYKITNTRNDKSYIGQTTLKPEKRLKKHFDSSTKSCPAIHNAIQKYGRDAFTVEILHEALNIFLDDLEVAEIKKHNSLAPNGYNLDSGGHANKSVSDQTRKKMSKSLKGRRHSPETRKKISEAAKDRARSPEYRKKLSDANKGRTRSPEHRKKLSDANKGRIRSPEHRKKLSDANKGKTLSPEHRKKLSQVNIHPDRTKALEILNSLPADMPLKEKYKILRNKFPERARGTVHHWVKKWSETPFV